MCGVKHFIWVKNDEFVNPYFVCRNRMKKITKFKLAKIRVFIHGCLILKMLKHIFLAKGFQYLSDQYNERHKSPWKASFSCHSGKFCKILSKNMRLFCQLNLWNMTKSKARGPVRILDPRGLIVIDCLFFFLNPQIPGALKLLKWK